MQSAFKFYLMLSAFAVAANIQESHGMAQSYASCVKDGEVFKCDCDGGFDFNLKFRENCDIPCSFFCEFARSSCAECECRCETGYKNEFGCCQDVDECNNNNNTCDVFSTTCINTPGSYYCKCKDGFEEIEKNIRRCKGSINIMHFN